MAGRTRKSWALAVMILTAGLLLSGCTGNSAAVPGFLERPDLSGAYDGNNKEETTAEGPEAGSQSSAVPPDPAAKPEDSTRQPAQAPSNAVPLQEDSTAGKAQGKNSLEANLPEVPVPESTPAVPKEKEPVKEEKKLVESGKNQPVEIKFSELYSGSSSRGLKFSEKLTDLKDKKVVMTGYMAPPLKPSFTFFVLTREPMAICPFCSSDASWPEDIVLTYLPEGKTLAPGNWIFKVTGTLELGSYTDPDTGFVSQIRIRAEKIETIK